MPNKSPFEPSEPKSESSFFSEPNFEHVEGAEDQSEEMSLEDQQLMMKVMESDPRLLQVMLAARAGRIPVEQANAIVGQILEEHRSAGQGADSSAIPKPLGELDSGPRRTVSSKESIDNALAPADALAAKRAAPINQNIRSDQARAGEDRTWASHVWNLTGEGRGEDQDEFLSWAQRVNLDSYFADPMPDSDVAATGLMGGFAEITLEAEMELNRLSPNPEAMRQYFCTVVAPTFRRLVGQNVDAERLSDFVLTLALKRRTSVTREAVTLAHHLFSRLCEKADKNSGTYQTWASLGDFTGGGSSTAHPIDSVFYYETMLHEVARTEPKVDDTLLRAIEGAANNLSGVLSNLGEQRTNTPADRVMNVVHRVATIASRLRDTGGEKPEAKQMWESLGMSDQAALGFPHVQMLATMMHMPGSWRHAGFEAERSYPGELQPHFCMALLETTAAAARIIIGRDDDEIVQTFYNAGVSLLRWVREGRQATNKLFPMARIALNAAGLVWALRRAQKPQAFLAALSENHALSCALSMLDAVSDMRAFDGAALEKCKQPLGGLVSALFSVRTLGPIAVRRTQAELFRVGLMAEDQLNIDFEKEGDFSATTASDAIKHLLDICAQLVSWAVPHLELLKDSTAQDQAAMAQTVARFIKDCLVSLSDAKVFARHLEWMAELLKGLEAESSDIFGVIDRAFAQIKPSSIVACGAVGLDEWRQRVSDLEKVPKTPIENFVKRLTWDFIG